MTANVPDMQDGQAASETARTAVGLAREAVWGRICEGDAINVATVSAALDRFELAVKASLPCSEEGTWGLPCPERRWDMLIDGASEADLPPFCPSCQARQEVKDA
jgi:hypothetical protein